jgi:gluconate 2-dehydrogenase gamma chain
LRRRHFITVSATSLGGVLVYGFDRKPAVLPTRAEQKIRVPLRFFTTSEALIVAAAAARVFPSDESGPGANEASVVIYIDRQLAGPYGRDRYRYTQPPFESGVPEQGYQGRANPRRIYRTGVKSLDAGFANLKPDAQDAALHKIEGTTFFRLLRQHTIEGMFCDPMHGGNADMIGWQLIGFPGPYMSWADEIDKHFGRAFRPTPKSLEDVLGHTVKGLEEDQSG